MFPPFPNTESIRKMAITPHSRLEDESRKRPGITGVTGFEVPTIMGRFGVAASAFGVAMVFFPGSDDDDVGDRMERYRMGWASWGERRAVEAGIELMGYLLGEVRHLETPVDLSFVSPFQRDVYRALRSIPWGETITYGELARLAGHAGKALAVGSAMRYNPAPIFVPCHRVVATGGKIGGWSGPPGWKERLLIHEGVSYP